MKFKEKPTMIYDDNININIDEFKMEDTSIISNKNEEPIKEDKILKYLISIDKRLAKLEEMLNKDDLSYLTPPPAKAPIGMENPVKPNVGSILGEIQSTLAEQGFGQPQLNGGGDVWSQAQGLNQLSTLSTSKVAFDDDVPDYDD